MMGKTTYRVPGDLTYGEARTMAAVASGDDPEGIEVWAVITFNHRSPGQHDLVITSNVIDRIPYLQALLEATIATIERIDNPDYLPEDNEQVFRLLARFNAHWRRFKRRH